MSLFRYCLFFLILPFYIEGTSYAFYTHSKSDTPPTSCQLFGERCSGTKYLTSLLRIHFPELQFPQSTGGSHFGWKHFPAWFSAPRNLYPGPDACYTLERSDAFLFIIIVRHPYDWVESLHRSPYHSAHHLRHIPLHDFVRLPWEIDPQESDFLKIIERNPWTGRPFKNILLLRTARLQNMLSIQNKVCHLYCINYETVRDHPQEVIAEIATLFHLSPLPYDPTLRDSFTPRPRFTPTRKLKKYLNTHLDMELERAIGYPLD